MLRRSCEVLLLFILGCAQLFPATPRQAQDLFDSPELIQLDLLISPVQMDMLRAYGRSRPRNGAQPIPIQVVEKGHTYSNVLVHLKGGGTFRPLDDKPSFTLDFNEVDKHQRFHGLTKLSFNNSIQDPTCLQERLARELFATAGVPVPRADNVLLNLNGNPLGVYVAVEGVGQRFLKKHFKDPGGTLYDAGYLLDVHQPLSVSAGLKSGDRTNLGRLVAATLESDPARRFQLLRELLDLDEFISFIATETILAHWDGYSMNRGNYRLYYDPGRQKFVFIPHGMDRVLGNFIPNLDLAVVPPMQGIVARAIISTPEGRQLHIQRVGQLVTNVFRPGALKTRVQEMDLKIAPYMERPEGRWPLAAAVSVLDGRSASARERSRLFDVPTTGSHQEDVADLCWRITRRAEHLASQLRASSETFEPAPLLKIEGGGEMILAGWRLKQMEKQPAAELSLTNKEGQILLVVSMPPGCKTASLRRRISLRQGHYSLRGLVQSAGTGPRIPAVLVHHSGNRFGNEARPTSWTDFACQFEVPMGGGSAEVELIWDIRDGPGKVQFQVNSLQLARPR
jgi:spore coat protein H